jgi:hypothetical protein
VSATLAVSALLSLFAALVCPSFASAKKPDLPPPSIGRNPETWASREGWHLRLGAPQRDTLGTSPGTALLAARTALEDDHWELDLSRDGGRRLTTQWKAIRNFFFRIFSGKAFGRCFVSVRPLSDDQVEVTFQGGLATRRDLEHSPVKGLAERSYLSAARVWQREVRDLVMNRLSGHGRHDKERK